MLLSRILYYSLIFLVLCISGCEQKAKVPFQTFEKDGYYVEFPEQWEFDVDTEINRQASRRFIFAVSEFSYFSLNIMTPEYANRKNAYDLGSYVEYFLTLLSESDPFETEENTKVQKSFITEAGYSGVKIDVEMQFMGTMKEEILIFHVGGKENAVYAVFYLSDDDILSSRREVVRILKSIRTPGL